MKKFLILLICFAFNYAFAQKTRTLSLDIDGHVNSVLYDRTLSNNSVGFGFGAQVLYRSGSFFRPVIDFTADIYGGTKELFLTSDGKPIYAKSDVITLYTGGNISFSKFTAAFTAGPSFYNSKTYLGIRPALAYRFFNDRMFMKISWTNIFQRDDISHKSFGYLGWSAGLKVF